MALCGMQPHAHVSLPVGWSSSAGESFVVYELLDTADAGKRLDTCRLPKGQAFRWADRLRLAASVASGLSHLRSCMKTVPPKTDACGLHLNLKLSSILFDRTGRVKLADMGFPGTATGRSSSSTSPILARQAEAAGASLAEQQVAEMQDLGRLLLELLLPDSKSAAAAASSAAECSESDLSKRLERCKAESKGEAETSELLPMAEVEELLGSPLDASAEWPPRLARELAEVGLTCAAAVDDGSAPPLDMVPTAGRLLQLCLDYREGKQKDAHAGPESEVSAEGLGIRLECIYSSQADVKKLPAEKRTLVLTSGKAPWRVGRQHQTEFFVTLVPDQQLCACIARTHFELWPHPGVDLRLRLRPVSANPLLVDMKPVLVGPSGGGEEVMVQNGSKVCFCYRDEVFLTLQLSLKRGVFSPEDRAAPLATFMLVCDKVLNSLITDQEDEARTIGLSTFRVTPVGRQHQTGFFERLLSQSQTGPFLQCISRNHFEVAPITGEESPEKQRFQVTCLSNNPIVVSGKELQVNEKCVVEAGQAIEFIAEDDHGDVKTFLSLSLRCQVAESQQVFTYLRPPKDQEDETGDERGATLPAVEAAPEDGPPFTLTLSGSAVDKDFPVAKLTVPGTQSGLTVGRAHQRGLHEKALVEGVLGFISRDHFSIKRQSEGSFSLVALSQNPMWLSRDGRQQQLTSKDAPVRLADGDVVLLYTGAVDLSPDGAKSFGTLRWAFKAASKSEDYGSLLAKFRE
eukprot:TRINITY_DN26015_c0_g1_i1.p1 TRINITY_DN26015_c0_g1~~TRINITY_DN26015_c0_g1_i1.p1  ORF type:complete len:831 (+),score=186.27 TRINITY_DN26015_c0_g1_i1:265-2493(+)